MPIAGRIVLVPTQRAVVIDSVDEEYPDWFAIAGQHLLGINITAAKIHEAAYNADHFVKLVWSFPRDREGRDCSGTGSSDGVHVGVGRNVVSLLKHGHEFVDNNPRV